MNQDELLKKLYYKDLIFDVKTLYTKAKEYNSSITKNTVIEWYKNKMLIN
jgi:hypothetical protein